MKKGCTRNILRTSNRRRWYLVLFVSVGAITCFMLSWYHTLGSLERKIRFSSNKRQEIPSLHQELTKRNLQKLVEEFWVYLRTEITSLANFKHLKNTTSDKRLTHLIENIDEISYKRWMHTEDLKYMCLKAISVWKNIRTDLLDIEKSSKLKNFGTLVRNSDDFPRLVERELSQLSDDVEAPSDWKKEESLKLGEMIERNMFALQNPANCSNVKKLVCRYEKRCGTGFGCQVHHVSYCLLVAYVTNRTLIINRGSWIYKTKWESVFFPFTSKCNVNMSQFMPKFGGAGWEKKQVVSMSHLQHQKKLSDLLPPAIPEHMADRLLHFHGFPHAWWVGKFFRYAMRGQPTFDKLLSDTMHDLNFTHPIVGVHIRRTDKLIKESKLYPEEDYMKNVISWYDDYVRWKPHTRIVRKVFVATDEPSLLDSLEKKYPDYVFVYDRSRSIAAAPKNRRSESSFTGIALDITLLSMTDFLVCTFSSNVGRAAYALMQTRNGDASQWAVSLDRAFFYVGQNPYTVKVIANHYSQNPKNKLSANETLSYVTKFQNGLLKGTSSSGKTGTFPIFKTVDVIKRVNMPHY